MIKIFSTIFIIVFTAANAQISVALKANLLFPTSNATWESISQSASNAYEKTGKNNLGFNVGISLKTNLASSIFLMPELYYTTFNNKITDPVTNTTLEAKNNRADLPVLLGYDVMGETLGIFAGPVASYKLSTNNQYNDFVENAKSKFTVGYQVGAQVKIKKIIITGKYEGAFTSDQREFINKNANQTIRYDNRPSLFLAGIGYKF